MNISGINVYGQNLNFQERFKLKPANVENLKKIASAAVGAGSILGAVQTNATVNGGGEFSGPIYDSYQANNDSVESLVSAEITGGGIASLPLGVSIARKTDEKNGSVAVPLLASGASALSGALSTLHTMMPVESIEAARIYPKESAVNAGQLLEASGVNSTFVPLSSSMLGTLSIAGASNAIDNNSSSQDDDIPS